MRKGNKRYIDWEENNKSVCSQMTCLRKSKELTKKFLELISDHIKVSGHKVNKQKSIFFLFTNNEQVEFEIKIIIPFTLAPPKMT